MLKIIVVDDDFTIRTKLQVVLKKGNYEIALFENGEEAFLELQKNRYDLMLLDVNMGGMDGFSLAEKLKANPFTASMPIIFITSDEDQESKRRGFQAGCVDYIAKPFDSSEVLMRVRLHLEIVERRREIEKERIRSEQLLLNILPEKIAIELKYTGKVEPRHYEKIAVLFTDFKGFTAHTENITPEELIKKLNFYFSAFDEIVEKNKLIKIKTIGDSYMCACGIPEHVENGIEKTLNAALEIRDFVYNHRRERDPFEVRIGVHCGPLVAGVIGNSKFSYDIWGDTVNIASRMESSGIPGAVNVSETVYNETKELFQFTPRGEIEAKGKGLIKMFLVQKKN